MGARATVAVDDRRAKLLARIRKLLALAGNNPNAYEAESALREATQLMQQHGISEREAVFEEVTIVPQLSPAKHGAQREELAFTVAKAYGCRLLIGDLGIGIHGPKAQAKAIADLYELLTRLVETRCEFPGYHLEEVLFIWRSCFWMGFIDVIRERTRSGKFEEAPQSLDPKHAPTLVKDILEAVERVSQIKSPENAESARQQSYLLGRQLGGDVPLPKL